MNNLLIKGGHLVTPVSERITDILISGSKIESIADFSGQMDSASTIDAHDCYVSPGLIDLQVNGYEKCDFWGSPSKNEISEISHKMAAAGVTSYLATLITSPIKEIQKNLDLLASYIVKADQNSGPYPAKMLGVHLEGPCLSADKPGVHPPQDIQPLKVDVLKEIVRDCVKLVTVAPEKDPEGQAIKYLLDKNILVSLGHSNATYAEAKRAFDQGVKLITHTFNALTQIHQRKPGAAAAALLDDRVTCCIIADGLHVAQPMIELTLRLKKTSRTILTTDVASVGTSGGELAGSSILLSKAVQNMVAWKLASFPDAITMAAYNPAKMLGLDSQIGHIAIGKIADLILWDKKTLAVKKVIVSGKALD